MRGRRSRAEHHSCVFCGRTVRKGVKHVIGLCERWEALRAPLLQKLPGRTTDSFVLSLMGTSPEDDSFSQVLAFFAAVALAQIMLVLKKRQIEKVQAAEGNF